MVSTTVKLLLELHQLSELVLVVDYKQDLRHVFECFSKLHNIRKLRIEVHHLTDWDLPNPDPIDDLGKVLGANLNLTHFELFQHTRSRVSFSTMFSHIPASTPLKLEHLGIHDTSLSDRDLGAIILHIRSLSSIYLAYPSQTRLIMLLHSERIFPPVIQTTLADVTDQLPTDLIHYLNDHPGIIDLRLSLIEGWYSDPRRGWNILLEILARHFESLTHLTFFCCGWHDQAEFLFLQCTKLEQLELSFTGSYYCNSVVDYTVSEQSTTIHDGVENVTPVEQSFASYCSIIKLNNAGDHQPDGI